MKLVNGSSASAPDPARLSELVERWGLAAEPLGLPRLGGRLLGWLHLCDPAEQSAADLSEALDASAGGISTMARQLVALGFAERVAYPGDRRAYYRLRRDAWTRLVMQETTSLAGLRELADDAATMLGGGAVSRRAREMRHIIGYLEIALPRVLEDLPPMPEDDG